MALERLSTEEKYILRSCSTEDKLGSLNKIMASVAEKKKLCMEKRWIFRRGKQVIIIRDQLEKIVVWLEKFQAIGDVAVNFDPMHAALPWAGVRFLLQVRSIPFVNIHSHSRLNFYRLQLTIARCLEP